jgi:hypothetical protein
MLTRLLLSAAVALASVSAIATAPANAQNCSQTKPPYDSASKQIDHGDMLWISRSGTVGITTPAGTGVVQVPNAGPMPLQAIVVDAQQNGQRQLIVSNGRGAHLYLVNGCDITTVIDPQGQPFMFDLENLRGQGTGIGCVDLGEGRRLASLQAVLGDNGWTVKRTAIDFDGATAKPGRTDTQSASSSQDPIVTAAQSITCGDMTMSKDGVAQQS